MNTSDNNILNVVYNNHHILIDNITEYDYNGDIATVKKFCTVTRHDSDDATPMMFNVSPYTSLEDMEIMAKVWIDCGCPTDRWVGNSNSKWTKETLHHWITA